MKFIIKSVFTLAFFFLVFLFFPPSADAVSVSTIPSSPLPQGQTNIAIVVTGVAPGECYQITSAFGTEWDGDAVNGDVSADLNPGGLCDIDEIKIDNVSKNEVLTPTFVNPSIILNGVCDDMKPRDSCGDEFKEGGKYDIKIWRLITEGDPGGPIDIVSREAVLELAPITGPLPSSLDCYVSFNTEKGGWGVFAIDIEKPSNMTNFNVILNEFLVGNPQDNTPIKELGYTLDVGSTDRFTFALPAGLNDGQQYKITVEAAQNDGKLCFPQSGLIFTGADIATPEPDPDNSGDVHDNTDPSELAPEPGDVTFGDPNKTEINTPFGTITLSADDPGSDVAQAVLNVAIGIAGGIAFLMMIFGAYRLIFAAGNPDSIQQGREIITAAIAGLLVIIFAVAIMNFLGFTLFGLSI